MRHLETLDIEGRFNKKDFKEIGRKDFFFFFLGPVCVGSGSTSAFKAYCAEERTWNGLI
jgi:hypothetical protein